METPGIGSRGNLCKENAVIYYIMFKDKDTVWFAAKFEISE